MKRAYGNSCFKSMMVSEHDDDNNDSSAKCRERRRQRMAMRRMAAAGASASSIRVEEKHNPTTASDHRPVTAIMSLISIMEPTPPPVYGTMSVIGRQREMEDEVSVRTGLCRPEVNGFRPVHFYGVFDGHGGRHVSTLCKEYMHVIMEEELMRVTVDGDKAYGGVGGRYMEMWRTAIDRSFRRMDEMALRLCVCGGAGSSSSMCSCNPKMSFVGSTAVVSILTKEYVFVANCGDSRAVLCRNGKPIPLSLDHKD